MTDPQRYPSTSGGAQSPAAAPSGYPGQAAADARTGYPIAPGPRGSDGVARLAFILAIVTVSLAVLNTIFVRFVIFRLAYDLHLGGSVLTGFNIVSQVVLFLAYATTLVFGLLGARSDRKLLAGIAIGVGGAGAINLLFALLSSLIASLT